MSQIPHDLKPDDLRREADRRELILRVQALAARCEGRNHVVEALCAINGRDVRAGSLTDRLRQVIRQIAADDKRDRDENEITGGDVNIAGLRDWWGKATAELVVHVEPHEVIKKIQRSNYTGPSW